MRKKKRKTGRRRARRNAPPMVSSSSFLSGYERTFGKPKKKRTKASKKAAAARRAASTKRKLGRKYGPFKSLTATIGGRHVPTYMYRGKRGKATKIPLWAILGGKSKRGFEAAAGDSRVARRIVATKKRRDAAARRVQLHGDAFTPNRRGRRRRMRVIPYETWSANMSTKRRRKKARKSTHRRKTTTHRKRKRHAAKRNTTHRRRRRAGKRRGHRRARRVHENKRGRRRHGRRRHARRNRRRAHSAVMAGRIVMNKHRRRRHRRARRNETAAPAAANPRRRRRHSRRRARRNAKRRAPMPFTFRGSIRPNRRRHHRKARRHYEDNRRHYRRNPDFTSELKSALKVGVVVGVGFFAHKALSKVLTDNVLSKVSALGEWTGLVSGLLTAAVGIPLARKVAPAHANQIGIGMAVSFVQSATMKLLEKLNQPTIAGYLAGYPDSTGRAYQGYGEYMAVPGMSGFGDYTLAQAAAGYGATPLLAQAAAGYGATPLLAQAAAGVGDAASMGEYIVQGASGIGEYEQVPTGPFSGHISGVGATNEGIYPDLSSAERALSVAEAAAGVGGMGDLPFMSTLNPTVMAQPVPDAPSGSRAGILEGGDGIFG
jgi:hypothetical protein